MHSQKLYFCNWENWVQWGIIINVLTVRQEQQLYLMIDWLLPWEGGGHLIGTSELPYSIIMACLLKLPFLSAFILFQCSWLICMLMLPLLSAFILFKFPLLICWFSLSFQLSFCFNAHGLSVDSPFPLSFHFVSITMAYLLILPLLSAFMLFQFPWLICWFFLSFQSLLCFNYNDLSFDSPSPFSFNFVSIPVAYLLIGRILSVFTLFQLKWLICWCSISFQLSFFFNAYGLYVDDPSPFSFHFVSLLKTYMLMLPLLSAFILFQSSWLILWCSFSFQLSFCFNAHGLSVDVSSPFSFPFVSMLMACWCSLSFQLSFCFNFRGLSVDWENTFSFHFVSMLIAYLLMLSLLSAFFLFQCLWLICWCSLSFQLSCESTPSHRRISGMGFKCSKCCENDCNAPSCQ